MNHVEKIPFGDEGCFLLLSFRLRKNHKPDVRYTISYLFQGEKVATEWEPEYGPIQIWFKGDDQDHYAFDRIMTPGCDWSQLGVDNEGLRESALRGDHAHIFRVLKSWANRDVREPV